MNAITEKARTLSPSNPFYGKIPMENIPGTDLEPMQITFFSYDKEIGTPNIQVTLIICKSDLYENESSSVKVNIYAEKDGSDYYIFNLSRDFKHVEDTIDMFNALDLLVEKIIKKGEGLPSEELVSLLVNEVAKYIDPIDLTVVK